MLHEIYAAQQRREELLAEAERERLARRVAEANRNVRAGGRGGLLRRVLARAGHGAAEPQPSPGARTRRAPARHRRARA
ncbi:hypothetical protein FH609_015845 [Streptomyces sp. 3MP-14]|uniref:Uncharacterized protein n=1 Tax=Streptomyces mimosae TaxID=2586635 RepID=A0A5N6AC78_9ACTN|nr:MULTISPECIES: hypothetical protein [Streptomyces]KAB8165865.1 hypothetical protein FH607_013170 [Streptomyces mimosae]KAB8176254.1 hypothetical protein FH609_015845 [Streptomyces sp. 3MP-14]